MMEHIKTEVLQFRCPCCQKLYSVDQRLLQSAQPEFECRSCSTTFNFNKADIFFSTERSLSWVETKIKIPPAAAAVLEADFHNLNCPKCNHVTPKAWESCKSCGVILSKLTDLNLNSKIRVIPSLMNNWKEVLEKFDVGSQHERFHKACWELNSVDFGIDQYLNLKAAVVSEDLKKAIDENLSKLKTGAFQQLQNSNIETKSFFHQFPWGRFFKVSALSLSATLVILGLIEPKLKNMIGVGTALCFLIVGFIVIVKGRFNPSDLWD